MASREEKLLLAKNRLCTALGDSNTSLYMSNMKNWFRNMWTKEQFDLECRRLLTPEQRLLHNEFLIAILKKITTPWHNPDEDVKIMDMNEKKTVDDETERTDEPDGAKKRVRKLKKFHPYDFYDGLPASIPWRSIPWARAHYTEDHGLFLPDRDFIMGRLLISAWENGLDSADDKVAEVIEMGMKKLLKNILTAIINGREHHRVTNNGNFSYDFGSKMKHPYARNTVTRQIIDDDPIEIDEEIPSTNKSQPTNSDPEYLTACENYHQSPVRPRIKMIDLFNALQDKNLIPCHKVYSLNIERCSQMLT